MFRLTYFYLTKCRGTVKKRHVVLLSDRNDKACLEHGNHYSFKLDNPYSSTKSINYLSTMSISTADTTDPSPTASTVATSPAISHRLFSRDYSRRVALFRCFRLSQKRFLKRKSVIIETMSYVSLSTQPTIDKEGLDSMAADLFAPRPGHSLSWTNVNLKIGDKQVLANHEGMIQPNEILCIMDHSGSGKTSLLHVLAGKISSAGKTIQVTRDVKLDGVTIEPSSIEARRKISFVAQKDHLHATSTVREAIRFSARMRSTRSVSDENVESLVYFVLQKLHLEGVADNLIGGAFVRGLSGGEMRRVSLALELVERPSILFLDEVTTG